MTNLHHIKQKRLIYKQILSWMSENKISQTALAKKIGVSAQQISNILHGRSDFPVAKLEIIGKLMNKKLSFTDK